MRVALLDQVVELARIDALDFRAGLMVSLALALLDVDVLGAQQILGGDRGLRIRGNRREGTLSSTSRVTFTTRLGSTRPERSTVETLPMRIPFRRTGEPGPARRNRPGRYTDWSVLLNSP